MTEQNERSRKIEDALRGLMAVEQNYVAEIDLDKEEFPEFWAALKQAEEALK